MVRGNKVALVVWNQDVHEHQARPCSTCRIISLIVGEDWGCVELRRALATQEDTNG